MEITYFEWSPPRHSIWHIFWNSIWHPTWHIFWHFFLARLSWSLDFNRVVLPPSWHSVWHKYLADLVTFFRHSIRYIFGDSLSSRSGGGHFDPGLAVQVRKRPLRFRACSWGSAGPLWSRVSLSGPAGTTAILRLQFGPAETTLIQGLGLTLIQRLLFGSGRGRCPCRGPAGITLIQVAVRVWQRPLSSIACSWGPAGMTLIQRLLFGLR